MSFKQKVAENIKHYRKLNKLTLKEVAAKCGMTEANLQKYESGNMKSLDVDTMCKIADALDVKPEVLTGWQSDENLGRIAASCIADRQLQDAISKCADLSEADRAMVIGVIDRLYSGRINGS